MRWSIAYDHLRLPSYNPDSNKCLPSSIKNSHVKQWSVAEHIVGAVRDDFFTKKSEGYLPYCFKGDTVEQVIKNYCLFSAVYQPYVLEVTEHDNFLVFILGDVPDERMPLLTEGLFPEFDTVNDNVLPFMFALTDVYALPTTIEHTEIDGVPTTTIKRYHNPKYASDEALDQLHAEFSNHRKGNLIAIEYAYKTEEQYGDHQNDFLLFMLQRQVSNQYTVFDINAFVDGLVTEMALGDFERFYTIRQSILLTMELRHTKTKKKKRWSR